MGTAAAALAWLVLVSGAHAQPPPGNATPPTILSSPEPPYPEARRATGEEPTILLHVTVERDGSVSDAHAEVPGDEEFDRAAIDAMRTWQFAPAQRDGTTLRGRVRVAVRFHRPIDESESEAETESADPRDDEGESTREAPHSPVHGEVVGAIDDEDDHALATYGATGAVDPLAEAAAPRGAGDVVLAAAEVHLAPRRDGADVLSAAPGLYVARGEGDGVATAIALRGFDADHGQDVELSLGGVPLNAPSHVHGQGYTDLGFLLPEVISAVRVTEGVHDPHQGDFAIAGSVDLSLGVAERGLRSRTSYGSFETFRESIVWAPTGERDGTFAAAAYRRTSGFGTQRSGDQGTLLFQLEEGDDRLRGRITGILHGARYGIAGIVRYDDIAARRVGFYDAYGDPAAAGQVAAETRASISGSLRASLERGSFLEGTAWVGYDDFALRANYTGYLSSSSEADPALRALGDRFRQTDRALTAGLGGRWRSERVDVTDWLHGFLELGVRGRFDARTQAHGLATDADVIWRRSVDADVRQLDMSGWVDLDVSVTDRVRLRGGLRADVFSFEVLDRITTSFVAPVFALVVPRCSIEVVPVDGLTLTASYGEGFRSPQAAPLTQASGQSIARVQTGDLGLRVTAGTSDELAVGLSGYVAALSSDLVFEADEGRLESIGPTTRLGATLHLGTHPLAWLRGALSLTYVRATLDRPPAAVPGETPAYAPGQALPYVPPLVVRAEASADERVATIADLPFRLRASAGFSMLSPRPLPYGAQAVAIGILDLGIGVAWGPVDLGVEIFNALDQRYAALEYASFSSWSPTAAAPTTPARALAAGAPPTVMVTLDLRVE